MIGHFLWLIVGSLVSFGFGTGIELWKGRGRRLLGGEWLSAVQPVYYETKKWHIQKVRIRPTIFGIVLETENEPKKLQWLLYARLINKNFLTGQWKSLRPGSVSKGYMTLQLSANGQYMCGHDYANVLRNEDAHFGILLLGRDQKCLQSAWTAMSQAKRKLIDLSEQTDFD